MKIHDARRVKREEEETTFTPRTQKKESKKESKIKRDGFSVSALRGDPRPEFRFDVFTQPRESQLSGGQPAPQHGKGHEKAARRRQTVSAFFKAG